jgi:hypothetical protein
MFFKVKKQDGGSLAMQAAGWSQGLNLVVLSRYRMR